MNSADTFAQNFWSEKGGNKVDLITRHKLSSLKSIGTFQLGKTIVKVDSLRTFHKLSSKCFIRPRVSIIYHVYYTQITGDWKSVGVVIILPCNITECVSRHKSVNRICNRHWFRAWLSGPPFPPLLTFDRLTSHLYARGRPARHYYLNFPDDFPDGKPNRRTDCFTITVK